MTIYEQIILEKKRRKLNNKDLGGLIDKTGDAFRMALKRESLTSLEIKKLEQFFGNENTKIVNGDEIVYNNNGNSYKEIRKGVYNIEAEVIPFEAYASYAESLETGTVDEDLDTEIFRVDRIGRGNYKAFIVKGDSMNGGGIDDTKDGATVLGRELGKQHWRDGFKPTDYGWIILCKENIFHKDIIDFNPETGDIKLHSRNKSPEYSDFDINLNDCFQIFKVIKRTF